MRIWNLIRGHFALLEGKTLYTLSRHKPFTIERVVPKQGEANWVVVLSVGENEKPQYVYLTDMLKVYFLILRHGGGWRSRKQIEEDIDISAFQTSYLMAMMTTFDDIEANEEGSAIRYVEQSFAAMMGSNQQVDKHILFVGHKAAAYTEKGCCLSVTGDVADD